MNSLRKSLMVLAAGLLFVGGLATTAGAVVVDVAKQVQIPTDTLIVIEDDQGNEVWRGQCREEESMATGERDRQQCGALLTEDIPPGQYTVRNAATGEVLGSLNVSLLTGGSLAGIGIGIGAGVWGLPLKGPVSRNKLSHPRKKRIFPYRGQRSDFPPCL